jgi:hypothetical protein
MLGSKTLSRSTGFLPATGLLSSPPKIFFFGLSYFETRPSSFASSKHTSHRPCAKFGLPQPYMPVATGSNGESHNHVQRTIQNPGRKYPWEVLITANVIVRLVQELQTGTEAQYRPKDLRREKRKRLSLLSLITVDTQER